MKSCDFLILAFLRILTVCYDNLFHCTNQSGPLFLIAVRLRFLTPRNATKLHPVSLKDLSRQIKGSMQNVDIFTNTMMDGIIYISTKDLNWSRSHYVLGTAKGNLGITPEVEPQRTMGGDPLGVYYGASYCRKRQKRKQAKTFISP